MPQQTAGKNSGFKRLFQVSIALKLVLAAACFFSLCTFFLIYQSISTQRAAFYSYANQLCLANNAIAAYAVDGDLVEKFAKNLMVDEDYKKFAANLDDLFMRMDAKYLYILTDTGEPGMYTYIYDATQAMEFKDSPYALGRHETVMEYVEAAEVMKTGKPFAEAVYYHAGYGELYYSYGPIFNSKGEVVAFAGIDIDIEPLTAQMNHYITLALTVFSLITLLFIVFYSFMVFKIYTKPTKVLIKNATGVSQGDLQFQMPESMLKRHDEIGQLAKAFRIATDGMLSLNEAVENTLQSVQGGMLGQRADESTHKGEYRRVISGLNRTMDSICMHFNAMPCVVAFFDASCKLLYTNRAAQIFASRLALDNEEDLVHALMQNHGPKPSPVDQLLKVEAGILHLTSSLKGPEGDLHFSVSLLRAWESLADTLPGENKGIMLVAADITELAQARAAAEAATAAKSNFLARMSHEIRTPMNGVLGMLHLVMRQELPDMQKDYLEKAERSAHRLLGVINDILDFSKIEAKMLVLQRAPFSISAVLSDIFDVHETMASSSCLNLNWSVDANVPQTLLGDELRIHQILNNLISNAIKFTDKGSISTQVSLQELQGNVATLQLTVRDTGIGLTPEHMNRLFMPFSQADDSTTRRFGGTGLGLSIVKYLVEMMGGTVSVTSVAGQGSTFTALLSLPVVSPYTLLQHAEPSSLTQNTTRLQGLHILVAEDNKINQMIIKENLEQWGCTVSLANDGLEAVEMVNCQPFDLIIMDIQMPRLDGLQATALLRQNPSFAHLPIVAMTAHAMDQDHAKSMAVGMQAHINKPIVPDQVQEILLKVMSVARGPA